MSEGVRSNWQPRGAWTGFARAGRYGRPSEEPGISLTLREGVGLAAIVMADGRRSSLDTLAAERFGFPLPDAGRAHIEGERGIVWSAPGQWLALSETREGLRGLADALHGAAAVTDQSDGRAIVRIAGPRVRELLAKGVAIDLHPRAFGPGSAAVTNIAHIHVQFWQRDDAPTFDVSVARSFAGSFWAWLSDAAAEFGFEVRSQG